jgi:hypothetical protein
MDWGNAANLGLAMVQLIPRIVPIVQSVEQVHAGKTGEEKKQAVIDIAHQSGALLSSPEIKGLGIPVGNVANVAEALPSAIDATVAVLNAAGVFGKSTPAAPVPIAVSISNVRRRLPVPVAKPQRKKKKRSKKVKVKAASTGATT